MGPVAACLLLAVIVIGPPAVSAIRGSERDWLGVPVLFAFLVLMGYVAPAFDVLNESDVFFLRFPGHLTSLEGAVTRALLTISLGAAAFEIAWYWPRPALAVRPPQLGWRARALVLTSTVYVLIGLGFFAAATMMIGGPAVLLGGLGDRVRLTEGLNYLFLAVNLLPIVAAVWWTRLITTGAQLRSIPFWIFTSFTLLAAALQGSKSVLFIFIVILAVLYHRLRRQIPVWVGALGAFILFIALTIYALVTREYFRLGAFVSIAGLLDPTSMWNAIRVEFLSNFIQLQTLTVLVEHVPGDVSYSYGLTYLSTLTMLIPRGVWPTKPLPSTGVFTVAFWPKTWFDGGTTLPPGLFGEMWLNFGVAGVIAGGAVLALIARSVQRVHARNPHDPRWAYVYALFVAMLAHYIRGDSAVTVIALILLLPALALLQIALGRGAADAPSAGFPVEP